MASLSSATNDKVNKKEELIHVVAVPLPAQGHMSPMMQLCKMIASQPGFLVTFVNVDSLHEEMIKHWVAPKGIQMRLDCIPFSWKTPRGYDAECMTNLGKWFGLAEKEFVPALTELVRRLNETIAPVRCILADYALPFTQDVADTFNIPKAILWTGTAGWANLEYHVPDLLARDHIFPSKGRASLEEANSVVVDYIRGLKPLRLADVPDYMLSPDVQDWKNITIQRSPSVKRAAWVLVNSFYELEKETFDFMVSELGPKFVPAGPLFLLDDGETGPTNVILRSENEHCIDWLNDRETGSVLYISFGSIAVLSVEQFDELTAALEESKKPFLWVIRPELVNGGTSEDKYKEFCERTKDQGLIISWSPQHRVLAHPSVGAFLTHCGWNSILESICNGVPMLGWPYGAEQNTNRKFLVEDWKIGTGFSLTCVQGLIKRGEIVAAIKKVMDDAEGMQMKRRVEELKKMGRKAVSREGGRSLKNVMELIHELRTSNDCDARPFG